MTLTIDDKLGEQLSRLAAERGCEPNDYLAALVKQAVVRYGNPYNGTRDNSTNGTSGSWPTIDRTNGGIQPGFIADPQERLAAYLASSWPGDETDEEMQALADWVDD